MPDAASDRALDRRLDRLIDLLAEHATVVLSGTKLCSELHVPQSTLWDWVERLRSMGLEIRGVPGTGYQLMKVPDVLTPHTIRRRLHRGEFGCRIHHLYKTDSTMNEAGRLAVAGAPHGTVIVAEEQTAGRGRLGHAWMSEPRVGLYFTLVLRPALMPAAAPILTLLCGVAVAEALQELTALPMDLRWPNDVMCRDKKCAGILVEMTAEPERIAYVLAGFGINVNHAAIPAELATEATSLCLETGRTFSRVEILAAVLARMEHYYERLLKEGPAVIVERFSQISSYSRGKRVKVIDSKDGLAGVTAGLSPEGVLLVQRDDGKMERVLSGHVRPQ
ncbi:MAG: biotin--[acetyl-CoA-carboxylase] ligase [Acidobacteria bacterium]|nr:biotin--[acetyl-CoA-carboxylase] ligase [Acidobacteriota bacterium]